MTATRRLDAWRQWIAGGQLIAQAAERNAQQAGHFLVGVVCAFIVQIFRCHFETPVAWLRLSSATRGNTAVYMATTGNLIAGRKGFSRAAEKGLRKGKWKALDDEIPVTLMSHRQRNSA